MPKSFLGYLQQRKAGFYFRRKLPLFATPYFGTRELYWSLDTPFRPIAQTRAMESWIFSNQALETIQSYPHQVSSQEIRLAVSAFKALARSRWRRISPVGNPEPWRVNSTCLEALMTQMIHTSIDPTFKAGLRAFLDRSISTSTQDFENSLHSDPASVASLPTLQGLEEALQTYLSEPSHPQSPFAASGTLGGMYESCRQAAPDIGSSDPATAERYFNRELSKAFLSIIQTNKRLLADPSFTLPSGPATYHHSMAIPAAAKPATPAISAAWEEYKQETKWKPNTERQFDSLIEEFVSADFVGDKPVGDLTRDDIIGYRNKLRRLPARRKISKEYREKSVAELLTMKIPAEALIGESTINDKLTTLGTFFGWCRMIKGYLSDDIMYKTQYQRVTKKKRGTYTAAHIAKLFDPVHYRPLLINKPYKYWIPLLGLFTGARISELAQLSTDDIVEREGIYSIRIQEGDEEQSVKSENGKRLVPLHRTLLQLGFHDFVSLQRALGHQKLFPELKASGNKAGGKATKWFTDFRRSRGIPDTNEMGEQLVFHSFRHTVTTNLRHSNVSGQGHDVTMVQQLVGHKKNTNGATDIYTHAYDDHTCKTVIDTLNFNLDIQGLKDAWSAVSAYHYMKTH